MQLNLSLCVNIVQQRQHQLPLRVHLGESSCPTSLHCNRLPMVRVVLITFTVKSMRIQNFLSFKAHLGLSSYQMTSKKISELLCALATIKKNPAAIRAHFQIKGLAHTSQSLGTRSATCVICCCVGNYQATFASSTLSDTPAG